MKINFLLIVLVLSILFSPLFVSAQPVKSPEKVFGFRMGSDKKLIDWKQVSGYFLELGERSDRVMVKELGKTTLGKPFLLSIISSEENIKNLDRYRSIQQQLANPYDLTGDRAKLLVEEGKVVVIITLNIHSTEIASSQESVELAYELATRTDPQMKKILDNVIILLVPSLNPDGLQMVVDWYRRNAGTPFEGCNMPWLYHHYAGHDNNRDWYMFSLKESRLAAGVLYHEWFPEIVLDQHQMGSTGPRLFMPPYSDPVNPNVHSTVMAEVNMLGKHVVADLQAQGFKGVITGMRFNAFFEGTMSKTPLWHNMVGILTEMASVRVATPVYLPRGSLGSYGAEVSKYSRVTDFLSPWKGGWWRLRDIIDYEKALTYSVLDLAATHKKKFMMNFYAMNRESIEKGKSESPFAFIVPLKQHDPNSASEMLRRLEINGARVFKSKSEFVYDGRTYETGTYVIPLAQPCRPFIKDLLEPQKYPDLKLYPGGPPRPPYDVTGWTLNLQMGVKIIKAKTSPDMEMELAESFEFGPSGIQNETEKPETAKSKYFIFERRYNNSFLILNELLKGNTGVYWSNAAFDVEDKHYPAGTFIVPVGEGTASKLDSLSGKYNVPVYGIAGPVPVKKTKALPPRLGIYHPWTGNMDEGWTRLVLDNYGYSYKQLYNAEIKQGKLNKKIDVIILPDMDSVGIMEGKRSWRRREPRLGNALKPEKYRGGIGEAGVVALAEFIKAGGTLICFGQASDFAIEKIRVPAVNVLKGVDRKEFYAPGSLLKIEMDTTHPLAYGMPERAAVRLTNSPTFRLLLHIRESHAVGYYGEDDPLLSGWLKGPEKLAGRTALAEIHIDKGRVILFGFRVQSRAQTFGTFKLLFNAINTSRCQLSDRK